MAIAPPSKKKKIGKLGRRARLAMTLKRVGKTVKMARDRDGDGY